MSCKYAYDNGYTIALDKVREYINLQQDQISREKREFDSGRSEWWRLTGQQDFMLKFMDEVCRLIGEK